jgi:protein-S-isoprenylcysteine O-methyltransferase Ste14
LTSISTQPAEPWTIDADRWPDVAAAAGPAARAAVARALFTTAVARLPLRVKLPDGRLQRRQVQRHQIQRHQVLGAGGPAAPVMVVHRPGDFFRRFGVSGLIGFGESYMAGDWDCADLTGLLTVFAAHVDELVPPWLQRLRRLAVRRPPPDDLQTVQGARRNIGRHYDLSNELFALFLVIGALVWLGGFVFESVGDWQLARFKAEPAHQGMIMDRGLWRYTRHPNYFGDFCMWWGLFLISLGSWVELLFVFAPLLMTYILIRGTGQRMTDRRMTASRPQYADYVARTSGFVPLPPKRRSAHSR